MESHLLQMRGLKQLTKAQAEYTEGSHLLQMRGLKLIGFRRLAALRKSHLLQMRGLKLNGKKTYNRWISRIFYRCVD